MMYQNYNLAPDSRKHAIIHPPLTNGNYRFSFRLRAWRDRSWLVRFTAPGFLFPSEHGSPNIV